MATTNETSRMLARLLRIMQIAWILLAVFRVGITIWALATNANAYPFKVTQAGWPGWTEAETRSAYAQVGLVPEDFFNRTNQVNVVLPLYYLALAIFIFWRRPDDWTALLASFLFLTFLGATPLEVLAIQNPIWGGISDLLAVVGSVAMFTLFCVFPDGRFVPRWTRFYVLFEAAIQVWRLFYPDAYSQYGFALVSISFIVLPFAQIYRYRRVSDSAQRQAIKWVVFGIAVCMIPLALFLILAFLVLPNVFLRPTGTGVISFFVGTGLWNLFILILPVAFTMAILRSRLWDIDVIIRRTLVYSALTAILALFYFGSVVILQQLLRGLTGQGSDLAIIISTLAIFILFIPVRNRVQRAIDQRFYRRKYDAAQVLAQFAATVRDEVDLGRLTDELQSVVQETMQPEQVSVWLRRTDAGKGRTRA